MSKDRAKNQKHYQIRLWISGMGNIREFLPKIIPYLRVKKKKALEAMSFIEKNKKGIWMTQREKEQILHLRKVGKTVRDIEKIIGRCRFTIYKYLKKYGTESILQKSHILV